LFCFFFFLKRLHNLKNNRKQHRRLQNKAAVAEPFFFFKVAWHEIREWRKNSLHKKKFEGKAKLPLFSFFFFFKIKSPEGHAQKPRMKEKPSGSTMF
jgi:hypothetical protein